MASRSRNRKMDSKISVAAESSISSHNLNWNVENQDEHVVNSADGFPDENRKLSNAQKRRNRRRRASKKFEMENKIIETKTEAEKMNERIDINNIDIEITKGCFNFSDDESQNGTKEALRQQFRKIEKNIRRIKHCSKDIDHPWKEKFRRCADYCIHDAEQFRQASRTKWLKKPVKKEPKNEFKVQMKPKILYTTREEGRKEPYAVYRVLNFSNGIYYLTPIYHSIFATDRADLRLVQLDALAINSRNPTGVWMGELFEGDFIGITSMSPTKEMPETGLPQKNNDPNIVIEMDYKPLWRVDNFFIVSRYYRKNVLICPYQVGERMKDKVSLSGFGIDKPIRIKRFLFPTKPERGILFKADLFIPEEHFDCYLEEKEDMITPKDYHELSKFASQLLCFSRPAVTPLNITTPKQKYTRFLEQAPTAFQSYPEFKLDVLQFSMVHSASMIATISNNQFDYQVYHSPFEIVKKRSSRHENDSDITVRFNIANSSGPPSIKLWQPSKKINLIIPEGRIRGTIQSSVLNNQYIIITARLTAANVNPFRKVISSENTRKLALVEQVNNPHDVVFTSLKSKELSLMNKEANGYKLLGALFGGEKIEQIDERLVALRKATYEKGSFDLDEHQSKYVDLVGKKYPGIVANSPFGCGKTTTMAVAALEMCSKDQNKVHLTLGMTNSSVVNLVEAAAKLKSNDFESNILRLISMKTRNDLDKNCQTEYDSCVVRDKVLKEYVLKIDRQQETNKKQPDEMTKDAFNYLIAYLVYFDLIGRENLRSSFARSSYEYVSKNMDEFDFERINKIFWKIYKARRISATVSSALSQFQGSWVFLRQKVETVQIDEASQLPQTALVALIELFPNACFTLVGDYHQLSPYCDPLVAGNEKIIGIGNVLERSYTEKLIPSVTLHYVYRSHPEITKALGTAFYDYPLYSKIKPEERSSKVKEFKWWNNKNYPFLFVKSMGSSTLCHKSLYNNREIDVVEKLLQSMGKVMEMKDIGIATFYKAQTNMLMKKYQESDVFVGTVDSFQGREKEVVIVCLTKNFGVPSNFLFDKQRINVALSRARRAVIIIGNHNMLEGSTWNPILSEIKKRDNICDDSVFFKNQKKNINGY